MSHVISSWSDRISFFAKEVGNHLNTDDKIIAHLTSPLAIGGDESRQVAQCGYMPGVTRSRAAT